MNKHKSYKIQLKDNISLSASLDAETSRLLSLFFLRLAKQTLTRCRRRLDAQPIDYLALYILVVSSLEAFINELYVKVIDDLKFEGKNVENLEDLFKNGRILGKWDLFPGLAAITSFNKGMRPWQDFDALVKLRNDLVHYNSEFRKPGYIPTYLESILRREVKGQQVQQAETSSLMESLFQAAHWTESICHPAMGAWALNTGKAMIKELLERIAPLDDEYRVYQDMLERLRI